MLKFEEVLVNFCVYEKQHPKDITLDFFNFLEIQYPVLYDNLVQCYADDSGPGEGNPRIHLYGWETLLKPENFSQFLVDFRLNFLILSEQDFGVCSLCQQNTEIAYEYRLIATYEVDPLFKINRVRELDGSWAEELVICRECAVKSAKITAEKAENELGFWV